MYNVLLKNDVKFFRNIVSNQQGSLIMVVLLTLSIGSAVFLFLMSTDKVAESVSELKSTQNQVVMRAEIRNNLGKLLTGRGISSTLCLNSIQAMVKSKFANFEATSEEAKFVYDETFSTNNGLENAYVKCLINPAKFPDLKISRLIWKSVRTSEPNLVSLTSDVSSTVTVIVKNSKSMSKFDYNLKHRVKPKSMDDFTVIFANYNNKKLINSETAPVTIMGKVLLDSGATNPSLSHLINLKMSQPKITYLDTLNISPSEITVTDAGLDDLGVDGRSLADSIPQGVLTNFLTGVSNPPWKSVAHFNDDFEYTYMNDAYVLPKGAGYVTAIASIPAEFNSSKVFTDTKSIFEAGVNSFDPVKESVSMTCSQGQPGYGLFTTFIFNNLSKNLTIDLSGNDNTTDLKKAVFCGVVAANKITIKLNNSADPEKVNHYLIGKFIVNDDIEVVGNGKLFILDGLNFKNSDVQDGLPGGNLSSEISTQLYAQKFYMTQNFFVPLFSSNISGATAYFFLPRTAASFFTNDVCTMPTIPGPHKCRNATIETPETNDILNYKNNLIYDAYALD